MTENTQITFEMPTAVLFALATSQGWQPMIEDTSADLVGDEYPQIPNPVSLAEFIESFAPGYITAAVLRQGRQAVSDNFVSIHNKIDDQLKGGAFDSMILAGDIDGILAAVKASL